MDEPGLPIVAKPAYAELTISQNMHGCVYLYSFIGKKKPLEMSDNFPFTSDCVSYGHGGILSGALWF